jgi:hypothetical protein
VICTVTQLDDRGFTFAEGSAPFLSLKTSSYSVNDFRNSCTPSRDIPDCSVLKNNNFNSFCEFVWDSCAYLYIIIVDRIIVGNVTVGQRLLFEARKLDVELCHV